MRISLIQVAYGDDEPMAARVDRVCRIVAEQRGADLVVLPELWAPTGFGYGLWESLAEPVDGPWVQAMADAARALGATLHAGSVVERLPRPGREGRTLANTSVVLSGEGVTLATYRKIHRFGFGDGEPTLMEAGADLIVLDLPDGRGGTVPVGLSTCYDLRFPELYRRQLAAGAQVFVVPAAWPMPRVAHWTLLGQARAVENQCVMVQCNTSGTHADLEMGGHSQVVAATGEVLGAAGPGEAVLTVEVDLDATLDYRSAFPVLADRRL